MIRKFFMAILIVCLWASNAYASGLNYGFRLKNINFIHQERTDFIKWIDVSAQSSELHVLGRLPLISGLQPQLENELNKNIRIAYEEKLEYAKKISAKQISFSYETRFGMNVNSIMLYITTQAGTLKEEVLSFNFNALTQELVSIKNACGPNSLTIVNQVIFDAMRKSPDNYNVGFSGIKPNEDFYLDGGNLFVLFDKSEIAPASRGIVSFSLDVNNITNITVLKKDYYTKKELYELKMLPLRQVCEAAGYTVNWSEFTKTAEISKGSLLVKFRLGENRYSKGFEFSRNLESAPEIIDGIIYVPISFFDSMLDLAYSVDANGNVILSYYKASGF